MNKIEREKIEEVSLLFKDSGVEIPEETLRKLSKRAKKRGTNLVSEIKKIGDPEAKPESLYFQIYMATLNLNLIDLNKI